MSNEEKQLLLIDLCARLPHDVKIKCGREILTLNVNWLQMFQYHLDEIKPYLRPMSSMTEEELSFYNNHLITPGITILEENLSEYLNWMHSHHFDYRGLIEKGLAIEAPKDMYKFD
jgi:hypothetical protein